VVWTEPLAARARRADPSIHLGLPPAARRVPRLGGRGRGRRTSRCSILRATIRWNVDKQYLLEVEARGVPIVPTRHASPGLSDTALPALLQGRGLGPSGGEAERVRRRVRDVAGRHRRCGRGAVRPAARADGRAWCSRSCPSSRSEGEWSLALLPGRVQPRGPEAARAWRLPGPGGVRGRGRFVPRRLGPSSRRRRVRSRRPGQDTLYARVGWRRARRSAGGDGARARGAVTVPGAEPRARSSDSRTRCSSGTSADSGPSATDAALAVSAGGPRGTASASDRTSADGSVGPSAGRGRSPRPGRCRRRRRPRAGRAPPPARARDPEADGDRGPAGGLHRVEPGRGESAGSARGRRSRR
jgi:hypothetical protein